MNTTVTNKEPLAFKLAQVNFVVGDLEENTKKILSIIRSTSDDECDFLVFPETTLTGYPPLDLLEREGFVEEQLAYLEIIRKNTIGLNFNVVIGAFSFNKACGKPLHNSLYVFRNGNTIVKYDKMCLPHYNIFSETRHCEPGSYHQIELKNNVIEWKGNKVAFFICEDGFSSDREAEHKLYAFDPVYETFRLTNSIDYCISINASPSNIGKFKLRDRIFQNLCVKYNTTWVYVNQFGANDGIIFDGQSFIMKPSGDYRYIAPFLAEDIKTVPPIGFNFNHPIPVINNDDFRSEFYFKHLVLGIKDYFTKTGFSKAVFGCSGGIDSSLVAVLLTEALGPENVIGITMPSKVSSEGSVSDSEKLCANIGIKLYNFPIKNEYDVFLNDFSKVFGEPKVAVTRQNIQPRERSKALMAFANEFNCLLVGTSNKSEAAVGYTTIGGDLMSVLQPINDLYKIEIFELVKWYNYYKGKEIIPNTIIEKPPSAELEEGQTDQSDLPPYEILDRILMLYIEQKMLSQHDIEECQAFLKTNSNEAEVQKIIKKVDKAEFKRFQSAVTLRVRPKAWVGRILPIVQRHNNIYHPLLNLWD